MSKKPKLYILCGYPFAGKSTLTKKLIDTFDFCLVGIDEINRERAIGQTTGVAITPQEWSETYQQAYKRIEELLSQGKTVIYDATNFTKQQREEPRQIAEKYQAKAQVIFVDVPKEVVIKRWQENRKANNRFDVTDEDFAQVVDNFQAPTEKEDVIRYLQKDDMNQWIKNNISVSEI